MFVAIYTSSYHFTFTVNGILNSYFINQQILFEWINVSLVAKLKINEYINKLYIEYK